MITATRPFSGAGRFSYPWSRYHCGAAGPRHVLAHGTPVRKLPYTMAGPGYKGMDPSDPLTYVRPWNPQPGMIAYLNFDGAMLQGRTPTQLQRGPQTGRRRLRIGGR